MKNFIAPIFLLFLHISSIITTPTPGKHYKIKAKTRTGSGSSEISYCLELKKAQSLVLKPCADNCNQIFQLIASGVGNNFAIVKQNSKLTSWQALPSENLDSGRVKANKRPRSFTASTGNADITLCPASMITRVESGFLSFSGTGWAGWSCPLGTQVVGGGHEPEPGATLHPVTVSEMAKPGMRDYPLYPHYDFNCATGETGWVVQNGGTSQKLRIYALCYGIIRVQSGFMSFNNAGGWAGWSCPSGTEVVGGGHEAEPGATLYPVAVSQMAKPGVGTYPNYPHYNFNTASGETGWVVSNGGTAQKLRIYALCGTDVRRTNCYMYSFIQDGAYYKIKTESGIFSSDHYLLGLKEEADLLSTSTTPHQVAWTRTSSGDEILWELELQD